MNKLWISLFWCVAVVGCDSGSTGPNTARPNFVVILTDDLDWRLMPHLERVQQHLVTEGATFTNFFVTTSICCPSRVSFLRGQYAHNHRVFTNRPPLGAHPRVRELGLESSTLATWLQSAGYRTAFIGKYINGYTGTDQAQIPPGWDEWYATIGGHYFDFGVNENGTVVEYPGCCDSYEPDVQTSKAVDFIRRTGETGAPFLVYLAPYAPHGPATPAPRHEGRFGGVKIPRVLSFNEDDVSDKPTFISSLPPLTPQQIDRSDEFYRQQLRSLLAVEDMLDSLVVALEAAGVMERTYIFFTSDNGFHIGEHRLGRGKTTSYDEDIRVPLLARGPGIPAGRTVREIVLNIDIAPTLAEFAGVLPPPFVDGRSFLPLLHGYGWSGVDWRDGFLIQRWRTEPNLPTEPQYFDFGYRAVRSLNYLYVEWDNGEFELYDRRSDPYELENIYSTADPSLPTRLSSWVDRLGSCAAEGCRAAEEKW